MTIAEKILEYTYSNHKYFRVYIFLINAGNRLDNIKWRASRKYKSLKSKLNRRNPFRQTLWNLDKKWWQRL